MPPTLIDIAHETRTSVSTVSRVLSGGAGAARISEATRQRVMEAARRMGYRPNLLARSLRTRKTHSIALLVSDIANPFFGKLASLIEDHLHREGYSMVLCNSGEDGEREQEYLGLLPSKGIDGLIVVPCQGEQAALPEMVPAGMPVVALDRPDPLVPTVSTEQEQATNLLCDALQSIGVNSPLLVCGPQHLATHRRRADVVSSRFGKISRHEGPAQRETGREAVASCLSGECDAIICTSNQLGRGAVEGIGASRQEIVIGCFDEIPLMQLLPMPLVCVVQDLAGMALAAVRQLLLQMQNDPAGQESIYLPAKVVGNGLFQSRQREII